MLDKLQHLSEENMIKKALSISFLLKKFGLIFLKDFGVVNFAKTLFLWIKIKPLIEEIIKENQDYKKQVEYIFDILDLTIDFKKRNPEILNDIFKTLEDCSSKYRKNKKNIEDECSCLFER